MSDENYHFSVVEITLKNVLGPCTNNGNAGYGTPLTCLDQTDPTTIDFSYKFTDTALVLSENNVYKCVTSINETTPILKAGAGVGSRATLAVTFDDFVGDPNSSSPALVESPSIENQGTFFGKLNQRNIIKNRVVKVYHYRRTSFANDAELIYTHHYIATDFKRASNGK